MTKTSVTEETSISDLVGPHKEWVHIWDEKDPRNIPDEVGRALCGEEIICDLSGEGCPDSDVCPDCLRLDRRE